LISVNCSSSSDRILRVKSYRYADGVERMTPILKFQLRGVEVQLHGVRQDAPPKMARIDHEIVVDSDEPDRRLELLRYNVQKYGTVFNTSPRARAERDRAQAPSMQMED
jgi:hypothetical protein